MHVNLNIDLATIAAQAPSTFTNGDPVDAAACGDAQVRASRDFEVRTLIGVQKTGVSLNMPGLAASDLPVIQIGDTITPESLEALRAACLQHGMGLLCFADKALTPTSLTANSCPIAL